LKPGGGLSTQNRELRSATPVGDCKHPQGQNDS
jgi:hypothetical protein